MYTIFNIKTYKISSHIFKDKIVIIHRIIIIFYFRKPS